MTGQGFSTLSVEIYSMAKQGISLTINALSTLVFLVTLGLVVVYYVITTKGARQREEPQGDIVGSQEQRRIGGESMKRVVQALAAAVLAALALMLVTTSLNSSQGYAGGNTIILYNWGDYIDPDLLDEFYEETGIKVVLQTFDSNEAMLTKLSHGGTHFDVAVPSEYAVAKMMEQGMLLPLDHSKIPNLEHIDPRFLDMPFDAGNVYSVPYFWGTVGIVNQMVGGKTITRWNDLWDPELRNEILLVDSARRSSASR